MIVNPGAGGGQGGAAAKHARNHALGGTDPLTPAAIGAAAADHEHSGYAAAGHSHTASEVGAAAADHTHTPASIGAAEKNHTHTASDVGARPDNWTPSASDVGAVPVGRKVNGKGLDADITLSATDVGAAEEDHSHSGYAPLVHGHDPAQIGAAAADHTHPAQTTITGNAGSATKLATARTIDGMSFNGTANITHFATCSTSAATAAKVVSKSGFTLATGARIAVKFTYANTAASPTLNVNSSGDKAIVTHGATAAGSGAWGAGEVVEFVYDGTRFVMVDGYARKQAMSGGGASAPERISKNVSSGSSSTVTVKGNSGYLVMVDGYGAALVDTTISGIQRLLISSQGNMTAEATGGTSLKITNNSLTGSNPAFVYLYKLW